MSGADHLFAIILLASGVLGYVRGFITKPIERSVAAAEEIGRAHV